MIVVAVILLGLGVFYAALLGRWAIGLRRVLGEHSSPLPHTSSNGHLPFVSVIVPARDEELTIEACLESILGNDYPEDRFEVIVVDDLSRDTTAERVRRLAARLEAAPVIAGEFEEDRPNERVRLLQMPSEMERAAAHKKRAITMGISHARGEIILTTDGDCLVPRGWIRRMAATFDEKTAFVAGPVLYPDEGTLAERAQALEFLSLVTVGAGAIGAGIPNIANGANVAYRREVFLELGGFAGIDHLTSGDDELLMQKIAYSTDWQVRFCAHPHSAVITEGTDTASGFFQQRRRWASKGRHYPHLPLRATVTALYCFYVALVAATLSLFIFPGLWPVVAGGWLLKIIPETILLTPSALHFGRGRLLPLFLPMQPLHAAYIVMMGAAGAAGGYTWKGRKVAR